MIEVSGALKHGWYEKKKLGEKFAMYCPTFKFLPCKTDGWTNTTDDIDQYAIHTDQQNKQKHVHQCYLQNQQNRNKVSWVPDSAILLLSRSKKKKKKC